MTLKKQVTVSGLNLIDVWKIVAKQSPGSVISLHFFFFLRTKKKDCSKYRIKSPQCSELLVFSADNWVKLYNYFIRKITQMKPFLTH